MTTAGVGARIAPASLNGEGHMLLAITQMEAAQRAASGVSVADELSKLAELRNQGVLSDAEYEELKRKAIS